MLSTPPAFVLSQDQTLQLIFQNHYSLRITASDFTFMCSRIYIRSAHSSFIFLVLLDSNAFVLNVIVQSYSKELLLTLFSFQSPFCRPIAADVLYSITLSFPCQYTFILFFCLFFISTWEINIIMFFKLCQLFLKIY